MPDDIRAEIVEIYTQFFKGIFGYCAYRLFSKDLAEDAASAAFLRLIEEYPTLRNKKKDEIRKWLYGAASNVVASYLRDKLRHKKIVEDLAREKERLYARQSTGTDLLDWPTVYEAVSKLKPRLQEVLVLRFYAGLDICEIAEALGMRNVTVRVNLWRAIRLLRRELQRPFGGLYETP